MIEERHQELLRERFEPYEGPDITPLGSDRLHVVSATLALTPVFRNQARNGGIILKAVAPAVDIL
jgi:hypothetical protein